MNANKVPLVSDYVKVSNKKMISPKEHIVRMSNVTKSFGSFTALDNLSLDVVEGEILTLLGPSGCGKTTLMRLIAGFESPTAGSIYLDDEDVSKTNPEDRPVDMVFQRYALFPHLDVFDNVAFGLRMKKFDESFVKSEVKTMLEMVQLDSMASRWVHELSGGQAQRVALARALINQPKVLLLDEPLAALDLKIRHYMLGELKRIHKETKTTFVYVTHDQDEAMILSDRIVLLNKGRIEQIDVPEDMYAKPKTLFSAKFLGDTNIFDAIVKNVSSLYSIVDYGRGEAKVNRTDLASNQKVWISIRPESFTINYIDEFVYKNNKDDCHGVINDVIFIGGRVVYTVNLGGDVVCKVQVPRPSEGLKYKVGDEICISWLPEAVTVLTC